MGNRGSGARRANGRKRRHRPRGGHLAGPRPGRRDPSLPPSPPLISPIQRRCGPDAGPRDTISAATACFHFPAAFDVFKQFIFVIISKRGVRFFSKGAGECRKAAGPSKGFVSHSTLSSSLFWLMSVTATGNKLLVRSLLSPGSGGFDSLSGDRGAFPDRRAEKNVCLSIENLIKRGAS